MVHESIYLDNNATTHPLPSVREAMIHALDEGFGNPSSAHSVGSRVRAMVAHARQQVAALIGSQENSVVFTGSGSESNNMVLASLLESGDRLVTSSTEHSSILKHVEHLKDNGVHVTILPVDQSGMVHLEAVSEALCHKANLVSIQWVNNETGTVQPIEDIAAICKERGVLFHTDAAQGVGKTPINVDQLPIDFLSFTAHKLHGPMGIGALYARNLDLLSPWVYGGNQEHGIRAGSEAMSSIAGMGEACRLRNERFMRSVQHMERVRNTLELALLDRIDGLKVNGDPKRRICNTTNLFFDGIDGQALVAQLDCHGILCSQSSACTSMTPAPSYVLRAMGLTETQAYSSVRFSVSIETTEDSVINAAKKIAAICEKLRSFSALASN